MYRRYLIPAVLIAVIWGAFAMLTSQTGSSNHVPIDKSGKPSTEVGIKVEGKELLLSSFKGKVVMVDFWATWCGPCRQTLPILDEIYKDYHPRGVEAMGVALEHGNGASLPGFVKDQKIPYPVGMPRSMDEVQPYGVESIPELVIIDKKGNVRFMMTGFVPGMRDKIADVLEQLLNEPS